MKALITTLMALLSISSNVNAQWNETTSNPINHLKSFYDMSNIIKILRLETDINNDGFNEIFLSPIQSDNNQDEENWLVYIGVSNGMFRLAGMHTNEGNVPNRGISFKKNQYKIGLIPEINKHGLLYLSSGRGGQALCQLHAIVIEGEGWKNVAIGQLVTVETHYEELAQRFPNPPVPAVQELAP